MSIGSSLLGAASNYSYPLTTGLLATMSQPGAVSNLVQSLSPASTTPGSTSGLFATPAPYTGTNYNTVAQSMAGNPYTAGSPSQPQPTLVPGTGSGASTTTTTSGGSSAGSTLAGILGTAAAASPVASGLLNALGLTDGLTSGGLLAADGINGALGISPAAESAIDAEIGTDAQAALEAGSDALGPDTAASLINATPDEIEGAADAADAADAAADPALADVSTAGVDADAQAALDDASSGLGAGTSALGTAAQALGAVGAAGSLYNEIESYESGATGSDALSGAETGAGIGTAILPGIGTAIGGLLGGAAGAISSAFGGGSPDPESETADALDQAGAGDAASLTAPQAFQYLAGVMDAKNDSPGHAQPIELVFGQAGEGNLLNQMASQIDAGISSGTITPGESASQVYSSVIAPWLSSEGAAISPNSVDVNGANEGQNLVDSLTDLIGDYMGGSLLSTTPIGISGQKDTTLPSLAAFPSSSSSATSSTGGLTASPVQRSSSTAAASAPTTAAGLLGSLSPAQLAALLGYGAGGSALGGLLA